MAKLENQDGEQHNLLIEVALFVSCASAPNAINNVHFHQLLQDFRPDFKLPPIGTDLNQVLDAEFLKMTNQMKGLLRAVPRFTLILNVLEMAADNSLFLCISIGFVASNKLQVMLLDVKPFGSQVQSAIEKTLQEYQLDRSRIIRTCIDNFEELDGKLESYHPIRSVHYQILNVLDEVLATSRTITSVLRMINSFCTVDKAVIRFEVVSGFALNSVELSRGKSIHLLLKYRAQFLEICSQFSDHINVITQREWNFLVEIEEFKRMILQHFKVFENGEYANISSILPRIHGLLINLKRGFKSLNDIPSTLASSIEQKLASIMNCKYPNVDPIYFQATFLSPNFYGRLNEEETKIVKASLEKLICKRAAKLCGNKEDPRKQASDAKALVRSYHDYVRTNYPALKASNGIDFWMSNYKIYGDLSHIAFKLLTLPIDATLPHESVAMNDDDYGESFGDDYSIKNPADFIRMTKNFKDLKRNAIIRLNGHLK